MENLSSEQLTAISFLLFGFLFAGMLGGFYVGGVFEKGETQARRRAWKERNGWKNSSSSMVTDIPIVRDINWAKPAPNPTEQLRTVMNAEFKPRVILNKRETRVFAAIEQTIRELEMDWRLMAQVSLGEVLWSDDKPAYWAINSKRVDMLIVDTKGMPLHAIEYQGSGHHIGGDAAARDAVKKEALRKAGIGYIEVSQGDTVPELRLKLAKLSAQAMAAKNIVPKSRSL
jgi:Protein of unknown function (DUF2726)